MDLNKLAEKLKAQKNVGANREGQLVPDDPRNNGNQGNTNGFTTLEPKRFFKC
tara:strand:- start:983 stop:1141 length:159 start_codon:yes stop_codon:yes gene_type:complete